MKIHENILIKSIKNNILLKVYSFSFTFSVSYLYTVRSGQSIVPIQFKVKYDSSIRIPLLYIGILMEKLQWDIKQTFFMNIIIILFKNLFLEASAYYKTEAYFYPTSETWNNISLIWLRISSSNQELLWLLLHFL